LVEDLRWIPEDFSLCVCVYVLRACVYGILTVLYLRKKNFFWRNTFPRIIITIYSWRINVCHLITTRRFSPIANERMSKVAYQKSISQYGLLVMALYAHNSTRVPRLARETTCHIRDTCYSEPTYSAINVSHSYELKREKAERGAREPHTELKARCHIIIVLWQVRASRLGDDKNESRHAELSSMLHHEVRLLMCKTG